MIRALIVFLLAGAVAAFHKASPSYRVRAVVSSLSSSIDPNFASKLPELLKAGSAKDRPDPDVAKQLRLRYEQIASTKTKAAIAVKKENPELAAELEELADEMNETRERFINLAMSWDAWSRPDPDLAVKLRDQFNAKNSVDPNFEAHKDAFMKAGLAADRADPDLPSQLRMMKYKQGVEVKRLAAKEIREKDPALADELEEIADEIMDSHARFEAMAADIKKRDAARPKLAE